MELKNIQEIPERNFINMDQTSVQLVPSENKTYEKTGAKQVDILTSPGEKTCYTVTLFARGNGEKLPAIVVFKTKAKDGKLPKSEVKKIGAPANVIVTATNSGWWNGDLDKEILRDLLTGDENAEDKPTVLIRDQFPRHKTSDVAEMLEDEGVLQVFVPAGCTGQYQPLDVSVNVVFKKKIAAKYHSWRKTVQGTTKSGYQRNPTKKEYVKWISEAWYEIPPELIQNAFGEGCWKHVHIFENKN